MALNGGKLEVGGRRGEGGGRGLRSHAQVSGIRAGRDWGVQGGLGPENRLNPQTHKPHFEVVCVGEALGFRSGGLGLLVCLWKLGGAMQLAVWRAGGFGDFVPPNPEGQQ